MHQKTFFLLLLLSQKNIFHQATFLTKKTPFLTKKCSEEKNQIVTKSSCNKTQKLNLYQNSKTQIVTKLQNSNCEKTLKRIKL